MEQKTNQAHGLLPWHLTILVGAASRTSTVPAHHARARYLVRAVFRCSGGLIKRWLQECIQACREVQFVSTFLGGSTESEHWAGQ